MEIVITVSGNDKIERKLKRLGESLLDMPLAMHQIGERLTHYYSNDVFASQGGVFGRAWRRLAPSTVKYKSQHYRQYANVPLIATGTMQKSFRADPTSRGVTITNTAPYFVYHQSTATRTRLPRRQMMGINDTVKLMIKDAVASEIKRKLS